MLAQHGRCVAVHAKLVADSPPILSEVFDESAIVFEQFEDGLTRRQRFRYQCEGHRRDNGERFRGHGATAARGWGWT